MGYCHPGQPFNFRNLKADIMVWVCLYMVMTTTKYQLYKRNSMRLFELARRIHRLDLLANLTYYLCRARKFFKDGSEFRPTASHCIIKRDEPVELKHT